MKIKITSDGTPEGTKIVDAVTGEPLKMVTSVVWELVAGGYPAATVHVVMPQVGLEAEATVVERCPWCGVEQEQEEPKEEGDGGGEQE